MNRNRSDFSASSGAVKAMDCGRLCFVLGCVNCCFDRQGEQFCVDAKADTTNKIKKIGFASKSNSTCFVLLPLFRVVRVSVFRPP